MSEEKAMSREEMADAITADLKAAQAPEPAAPEVPAAAPPAPAAVAAPAAEAPAEPKPLELSDKSMVIDPADGQLKEWGAIKAERLRYADYTRKRQADAEDKRQFELLKAQHMAEINALKAAAASKTVELPDDDPYAQRIKAIEAANQAMVARLESERAEIERERAAAAREQLGALESRLMKEHSLSQQEIDMVEMDYMRRINGGEQVTLEAVAQGFATYRNGLRESAVKEFKEKNLVQAPAVAPAVPAASEPEVVPLPGTRSMHDAMRAEFAGLFK